MHKKYTDQIPFLSPKQQHQSTAECDKSFITCMIMQATGLCQQCISVIKDEYLTVNDVKCEKLTAHYEHLYFP